jgi:saccharopine dehydrogenase-like NADP-dependent oxidoreductase
MQGRAALDDLARSRDVGRVVAADQDLAGLRAAVEARGWSARVECRRIDASDSDALDRLLSEGFDVVIDLLPVPFIGLVARAAVRARVHYVNTFYTTPELVALAGEAEAAGVTLLPELGLDPGIDLVLLGDMARSLDEVSGIRSYGAGIPEPAAADNPIRYKVSWTFEGVLRSYCRAARLVRDGRVVTIGEREQFLPEHLHQLEVEGVGRLEAYPNGDALAYTELLGCDPSRLRFAGRYALRYPGHAAFWQPLVALGLLDDEPVAVGGMEVNKRKSWRPRSRRASSTGLRSATWRSSGWRWKGAGTAEPGGWFDRSSTGATWKPVSPP